MSTEYLTTPMQPCWTHRGVSSFTMVAMVSLARPTAARSSDPLTALWRRSEEAGALPILTWYDGTDRGELSARTLLTWVTKSVHLLDSEGIAAGDVARLSVFRQRPGHWTSCVWLLSSWWAGLRVDLTGLDEATVEVIGPDTDPVDSPEVLVQCSLTPLATPCQNLVPGRATPLGPTARRRTAARRSTPGIP